MMRKTHCFLFCILVFKCCLTLQLEYYSSFQFKKFKLTDENKVRNYVSLANDPKSNLPDSFTICSSIQVENIVGATHFIQMYTEDGSHWFSLHMLTNLRDHEKMSEIFRIMFVNPNTNQFGDEFLVGSVVHIVPHSWYHICLGLDTVSGLLKIVVNGVELANEEKDYFKNSKKIKPSSLIGKLAGNHCD